MQYFASRGIVFPQLGQIRFVSPTRGSLDTGCLYEYLPGDSIPKINRIKPIRIKGQLQISPNPSVASVKRTPTTIRSMPKIIAEKFICFSQKKNILYSILFVF